MIAGRYRLAALVATAALVPGPVHGAPDALRVEQIYAREPLIGRLPASITWAPDGSRFLYVLPGGRAEPLDTHVYDVRTGRDAIFFKAKAEGRGARPTAEFVWSPDSRRLAYLDAGNLWVVRADGTGRTRVAREADDPQWSPDGRRIAYVHDDNVYAAAPGGGVQRFSHDGSRDAPSGEPDWATSEEFGMRHAYRWSPDGTRIAYLHFDVRPVAPFPLVDFLKTNNTVTPQRYPLAGARNSIVSLRVAGGSGGVRTLYDTRTHGDYIASVGWTPAGDAAATIVDRAQKRLQYVAFRRGAPRALVTESDARWVDFHGEPQWLAGARGFVFVSARDGVPSLYAADANGGSLRRLTHDMPVEAVDGVDSRANVAYVTAAWPTRRDATPLAVPMTGGAVRPLAHGPGTHRFFLAADAHHFVRADSAFGVPPTFVVGDVRGAVERVLAHGTLPAEMAFGGAEMLHVGSPLGMLDAWIIRPPGFDPAKTYPVIMYVYGGPAAPTTRDAWGGDTYLFHQALAQRGYVVFSIDGPGSQIDGGQRRMYRALGPAALDGQRAGAAYLRSLPYVDPARIGIWGWSFGGYATAYALTHAPGVWKAGIAVAPVTDWRFYDSIYTERYMGDPKREARAYLQSSVLAGAPGMRGSLLLAHGTSDDNVHVANTLALAQALLVTGKDVQLMLYPGKAHGISGIPQRRDLFNRMLRFWAEHL